MICFFFLMLRRPPRSTLTVTLVPYTTLFRSLEAYSSAYGLGGGVAVENALASTLNEWIVLDGAFTGEEILAAGSGVGAYFKGLVRVESTLGNTDAVMQTHYLRIDDVTESTAAGNSAQIAQTASATVTDLAAQVKDKKNLTAQ